FFFQAEDGIRDKLVTGVQTCALPISRAFADRPEELARRWLEVVRGWRFDETKALIERHNRNYPAEARLPMDPRTGDFVLVNGKRSEERRVGKECRSRWWAHG